MRQNPSALTTRRVCPVVAVRARLNVAVMPQFQSFNRHISINFDTQSIALPAVHEASSIVPLQTDTSSLARIAHARRLHL
mmetsp:Transcript_32861/g.55792  ORF Transcript_32861/g.55792 Transcript_32861/m.55792 type:complete len:80 (-) Transcript_32861:72-311(-)